MISILETTLLAISCILCSVLLGFSNAAPTPTYNVVKFGAKGDGKSDSTEAFMKAWQSACANPNPATIYVPKGRYLLRNTNFRVNSQVSHLVINTCNNVVVKNVRLIAPEQSPNTDGIHVERSTGVTINGCTLQTGDDCISIGDATYNLFISNIKCGPGHGVSIGSLGKNVEEKGVENVTLTNAIFSGSDNGVRIKTWARPSNGFVRNVLFQNIVMDKVKNPIIIDQNYCPNNQGCPGQTSGIKISQITYLNINGTSATPEAVTFDCSPSNPCRGIRFQDINLTYMNMAATSSCKNIEGTSSGTLVPESCL
ncbi:hypothetical protein V8G54_020112 [Vigna mungo]|uniref:Polygalacturonase n=1 Tax=Vigna mungo TaxID=3915 RepID=A0AAQ3RWE2_VIGMU